LVVKAPAVTVTVPVLNPFGRPEAFTWIVHNVGVLGDVHPTEAHCTLDDAVMPMLLPSLDDIE
jgi:hypothetical protein